MASRFQSDHALVDLVDPRQVDGLDPVFPGQNARQVGLGNDAHRYQRVAEPVSVGALFLQRGPQLFFRDEPLTDEQIANEVAGFSSGHHLDRISI